MLAYASTLNRSDMLQMVMPGLSYDFDLQLILQNGNWPAAATDGAYHRH